MPAYGNSLNPSETKALVSFLTTLRGDYDLPPAIDASRHLTLANDPSPSNLVIPSHKR